MLKKIDSPRDLKKLNRSELPDLAKEIRKTIVDVVSISGGHLASSLGAVELGIALHYVFDTPTDKIIWDVGHQAYAHKLLTGRRDQFPYPAPTWRPLRVYQTHREPIRHVYHGTQQHLHFRRSGHCLCETFEKRRIQSAGGYRRRFTDSRSGL
jgi:hypothetical protein